MRSADTLQRVHLIILINSLFFASSSRDISALQPLDSDTGEWKKDLSRAKPKSLNTASIHSTVHLHDDESSPVIRRQDEQILDASSGVLPLELPSRVQNYEVPGEMESHPLTINETVDQPMEEGIGGLRIQPIEDPTKNGQAFLYSVPLPSQLPPLIEGDVSFPLPSPPLPQASAGYDADHSRSPVGRYGKADFLLPTEMSYGEEVVIAEKENGDGLYQSRESRPSLPHIAFYQAAMVAKCGFVGVQGKGQSEKRVCAGGWKCGCLDSAPSYFGNRSQSQTQSRDQYQRQMSPPSASFYTTVSPRQSSDPVIITRGYRTCSSASARSCSRLGSSGCCQSGQSNFCFTADTKAQRSDGRILRMDVLRVGDWILSAGGESNPEIGHSLVESWNHRMPEVMAEFLRIELEDERALKLTAKHYIYKAERCSQADATHETRKMLYADEVAVGDCLFVVNGSRLVTKQVVDISLVYEKGIYAPMTSSGNIVVEGILASAFTMVPNRALQDAAFKRMKLYDDTLQSVVESAIHQILPRILSGDLKVVDIPFGLSPLVELLREVMIPDLNFHVSRI